MKYCCLDVGNVLIDVNFNPFTEALSRQLNITMEDAHYFMNRTCKLHDMGLTCMADELKDHFHIKSQPIIESLLITWNQTISENYSMTDKLVEWITEKDVCIALLSNVGLEHAKIMTKIFPSNHPSLIKHFSCQVGARKPNFVYYQSFLQMHPEFKGCAYVDDLQENLDAGAKFGFRTYRFDLSSPEHCNVKELETFILA
jgi:FMN phosphatase YigB (HAD superfamily)